MTRTRDLALTLTALLTAATATACTGGAAPDTGAATAPDGLGPGQVLLLGDSVAAGEALALTEAFAESGVRFESLAAAGGGNVVGPNAEAQWAELPDRIADAGADVVVYQLTTYDWGTEAEQRAGYERLLETVTGTGAELVLVSAPPIKPDDFYRPHVAELERSARVARAVAEAAPEDAAFLDASAVWGDTYRRTRDGQVDRSTDGIHTCPQGAARFTAWLLDELAARYPGFTPAAPEAWANSGWADEPEFVGC